jgi:hypothetical protein
MSVMFTRTSISLGGGLLCAIALSACGTLPATSADKTRDPAAVDSVVVRFLQRQISEREKRIAELEAQLDALKVINQSTEKLRKPIRPPATLTPVD